MKKKDMNSIAAVVITSAVYEFYYFDDLCSTLQIIKVNIKYQLTKPNYWNYHHSKNRGICRIDDSGINYIKFESKEKISIC